MNSAAAIVLIFCMLSTATSSSAAQNCEIARMKCAYRKGCGTALQNYMFDCASVLAGRVFRCTTLCKRALISLASTPEGKELMKCDCNGSDFCILSKERVEVCRSEVTQATAEDTVVSCSVAHWICVADLLCSTALEYYRHWCHAMFRGYRCTHRCNNSLAILNRQAKAEKLRSCFCDGSEEFPCRRIKVNMERLCYGREDFVLGENHVDPHRSSAIQLERTHLLTWVSWLFISTLTVNTWIRLKMEELNWR
ncbi:growth arrest-specific protein 1-like [Tachypleus tridentatus]|uniref:growth arrest-specific protein 1-like n=1 Tax=Tachypleus tridentatus TaxID=6853 RepID=UPI003FD2E794